MTSSFSIVDRLVILAYAVALGGLAFVRGRRRRGDDVVAYLAAGRAVSLPGFVMNLVASWYGGILGVGEYAYRHGVANWIVFGVPYYVAALIFALFIAPRARGSRALTIPEQLRAAYGKRVATLGAAIVLAMTLPGAYALMAGTIVGEILSIPRLVAVVGVVLLSSSYLVFGGMRAVVAADRFYFILMYASFGIIVVRLLTHVGGLGFLHAHLDPSLFTWTGGQPVQSVLVWYVIALSTLVEPTFYEACFAARDPRTARNGILISILFWILFDAMTTLTGLYARVLLPDLQDASRAFPLLAEQVLPSFLRGLFFAGMLAVVMSTVDSYLFISAQTIGHDLLARWRGTRIDDNAWTRFGLACACAGSVAIAASGLSVVEVWHHLGSIGTPALLVPVVASFDRRTRMSARAAGTAMLSAAVVATAWIAGSRHGVYWLQLEPIFPALGVALLVWLVSRFERRGSPAAG